METTIKKINKLLEESTNELERYVISDILDKEDPENYIKYVQNNGCQSGIISNLIYYKDTKEFFNKFIEEIDDLREEMEDATGEPLKIGYPLYNWLAWFGYEETLYKIAEKIGLND